MKKLALIVVLSCGSKFVSYSPRVEAAASCPGFIKEFVSPRHFVDRRYGPESRPGLIGSLAGRFVPDELRPGLAAMRSSPGFRRWLYVDWSIRKAAAIAVGVYAVSFFQQVQRINQSIVNAREGNSYLQDWNTDVEESLERLRGRGQGP